MVQIDFAQKCSQDYLVIACSLTGFIQAFETRDKSSAQAVLKIRQWGTTWGLPYMVKCGFNAAFSEKVAELGVRDVCY